MRKFFIALIALFFRGNIVFMLSTMLLVLFANYVLTAKHRPYMSTVERENVKENHRLKVDEAQQFIDADMPRDTIPKDSLMVRRNTCGGCTVEDGTVEDVVGVVCAYVCACVCVCVLLLAPFFCSN